MPQGGFSRDFQRAAVLKTEAQKRKDEKERHLISERVVDMLKPQVKQIEDKLILKQDEIVTEFIQMTHDRNRLLKFLLWTNVVTLLGLSFTLGYFL
tara:strand:+ start:503 stop:790 length:288 start_codon:yes stop_codon:yes gene_type:complete